MRTRKEQEQYNTIVSITQRIAKEQGILWEEEQAEIVSIMFASVPDVTDILKGLENGN